MRVNITHRRQKPPSVWSEFARGWKASWDFFHELARGIAYLTGVLAFPFSILVTSMLGLRVVMTLLGVE